MKKIIIWIGSWVRVTQNSNKKKLKLVEKKRVVLWNFHKFGLRVNYHWQLFWYGKFGVESNEIAFRLSLDDCLANW